MHWIIEQLNDYVNHPLDFFLEYVHCSVVGNDTQEENSFKLSRLGIEDCHQYLDGDGGHAHLNCVGFVDSDLQVLV